MVGARGVGEWTASYKRKREGVRIVEGERCGKSNRDAPEGGTPIEREKVFFYL